MSKVFIIVLILTAFVLAGCNQTFLYCDKDKGINASSQEEANKILNKK